MTLQQLEYFLAALEHGSFSAAAERLLLAQPSLSEQIRRLEAELGVALFTRVGRGIAPTDAALAFAPHAQAALAEVALARDAVAQQRELQGGTASFGAFGIARLYPGAELVAAFRRAHPKVRVRLVGQNSVVVADAVRGGELEAGIVTLPIDDHGLDVQPIMRDESVYLSADAERLRRPVTIEQLAHAPLILSEASFAEADSNRRQLNARAQHAGVSLEPEIEVEDIETAVELAARGLGDAIVERGVLLALADRVPEQLGWRPLAEPLHETYAFVSRRGARLSPAARAFMDLAEARMRAIAAELELRPPRRRMPA